MVRLLITRARWCYSVVLFAVMFAYSWAAYGSQSSMPESDRVAPLFDDLGTLHHLITARDSRAQECFDQGLRFIYAFNHEEAVRSFEQAVRIDPEAAMAYWGIAYALGPNINAQMDREQERLRSGAERSG